jgi:hypothetical protein
MSPHLPSLADPERTALLRLDAAYEHWRVADAALAQSEIRLWTETLRGEDAETCRQTAAETLVLRDAARTARRKVLALLNPHGSSA